MVRRALFLLLVFAPLGQRDLAFGPLALAQIGPPWFPPIRNPSLSCSAQDVLFDFSNANVSGGSTAPDGVYYPRAGFPNYLSFLDTLPPTQRFLPTQVVGAPAGAFVVTCNVTVWRLGGRGGSLCGAGSDWCLRLQVAGGLPPPLANSRVYVLGRVVSGNATSHVQTPTPLSSIPDGGGLFSIPPGLRWFPSSATLEIWIFLELAASDSYLGNYEEKITFTYSLELD